MWPFKRRPLRPEVAHHARRHRRLNIGCQPFMIHDVLPWADGEVPIVIAMFKTADKSKVLSYVADRAAVDRDMARVIKAGLCYPSIPVQDLMANESAGRPLFYYILAHSLNTARGKYEAEFESQMYSMFRVMFEYIFAGQKEFLGGETRT